MGLPNVLYDVFKRPGMHLPTIEFDVLAAFIQGFDTACNGGVLLGFREWMLMKLDSGNNLSWFALAKLLEATRRHLDEIQVADERSSVEFLIALLSEFSAERDGPNGLRGIYVRYQAWIQNQPHFVKSSDTLHSATSMHPMRIWG